MHLLRACVWWRREASDWWRVRRHRRSQRQKRERRRCSHRRTLRESMCRQRLQTRVTRRGGRRVTVGEHDVTICGPHDRCVVKRNRGENADYAGNSWMELRATRNGPAGVSSNRSVTIVAGGNENCSTKRLYSKAELAGLRCPPQGILSWGGFLLSGWCRLRDSNTRPHHYE